MGEKVCYYCRICTEDERYENSDRRNVKRHITKSGDAAHRDRNGSEPGVIGQTGEDDTEEPGVNANAGGTVTVDNNTGSYTGPESGIDMTMQHLSEASRPEAGDTARSADVKEATLIALTDDQLVQLLSAEGVDSETKKQVLSQIRDGAD